MGHLNIMWDISISLGALYKHLYNCILLFIVLRRSLYGSNLPHVLIHFLFHSDKSEVSWSIMNRKCYCKHDISTKKYIGTGIIRDKFPIRLEMQ